MKGVIILLCLLFISAAANSQDSLSFETQPSINLESFDFSPKNPATLPATREYASEKIERRRFDEKKWKAIVEARNYTDTRTKKNNKGQKGTPAIDDRSGNRAQTADEDDPSRYDYEGEDSAINIGPLGQVIFYGAIIAIIAVIIMQIVRNTSFKLNPKRTPTSPNGIDDIHDITELDTESLIEKAQKSNDYKLVIRLYFLDLLKKLNETGVIVWTKDKTNRDYLSELFSKQYYFNEVRNLTLAYERIWYGEHVPTQERYLELRNEFQAINQKFKAS